LREFEVAYFAASGDDAETNRKFAESLNLDYPILSDPGKEVARAYGVIAGESKYCARHTVYIGKSGKVLYVDKEVKPASAGTDMAARLKSLGLPGSSP
jgi:peroxiredoxin Q/BCP